MLGQREKSIKNPQIGGFLGATKLGVPCLGYHIDIDAYSFEKLISSSKFRKIENFQTLQVGIVCQTLKVRISMVPNPRVSIIMKCEFYKSLDKNQQGILEDLVYKLQCRPNCCEKSWIDHYVGPIAKGWNIFA